MVLSLVEFEFELDGRLNGEKDEYPPSKSIRLLVDNIHSIPVSDVCVTLLSFLTKESRSHRSTKLSPSLLHDQSIFSSISTHWLGKIQIYFQALVSWIYRIFR